MGERWMLPEGYRNLFLIQGCVARVGLLGRRFFGFLPRGGLPLSFLSHCGQTFEREQPLEVIAHAHQQPFQRYFVPAA